MKVTVAYTSKYLNWQLGSGHPTNPERARLALRLLETTPELEVEVVEPLSENLKYYQNEASFVHDSKYLRELGRGVCGEWAGEQPVLGETAFLMFGGTVELVNRILEGENGVFFNPQGAKHHAHFDRASGFCALNDMAYAALTLADAGRKVVYLDWDAHHGDGVEELLRGRKDITTISIHEYGIFPGTGGKSGPGYINYPMDHEAGDAQLGEIMRSVEKRLGKLEPDVILLACGADGLEGDPLSSLRYTQEGLDHAARLVGSAAARLGADVLIGGAGGYQPLDEVPEHWARCVSTIARWLSL